MQAREAYQQRKIPFEYLNVLESKEVMDRMLHYSGGRRMVPVVVESARVEIGYNGGS